MKYRNFSGLKRFSVFEFDPATGELRKHGMRIRIARQAGQLLAFLLESPGKVRSRDELRQHLWPDNTFVDFEHNLNKTVFALRAALCDSATNPRFIETLVGQGYRFILAPQVPSLSARVTRRIESVAVLPFVAEDAEPELDSLGHQVARNLIDGLSRIFGLRVLAYSTVKHSWQQKTDPLIAGRNLGVRGVVTGEFIQRGHDVLLHAELVDVADGTQLWGAQAKCDSPQGLKQSEEIAEEISRQLLSILSRREAKARPKLLQPFSAGAPSPDAPDQEVGPNAAPPKLFKRAANS